MGVVPTDIDDFRNYIFCVMNHGSIENLERQFIFNGKSTGLSFLCSKARLVVEVCEFSFVLFIQKRNDRQDLLHNA